jgi:hypothetical protein
MGQSVDRPRVLWVAETHQCRTTITSKVGANRRSSRKTVTEAEHAQDVKLSYCVVYTSCDLFD